MTTYLKDYAHFTNTQDMDVATRRHVIENWSEMNPTDRAALDMIRRAIRKLEKLGIIERIHYIRPVMNGLGATIFRPALTSRL